MDIEYSNSNYFLSLDKIYLGVAAQTSTVESKDDPAKIFNVRTNCLSFYIELIKQTKAKFNFDDNIFKIIRIIDPKEAQSFNQKDLTEVLNKFPSLNNFIDSNKLQKEWRSHALLEHNKLGLNQDLSADEYWNKVFNLRNSANEPLFDNLKKVMCLILVLPFSNACVERIFSQLKLIKTDHRNRLNTNTIAALMITKENIKDLPKYEPTKSVITSNVKLY